MPTSNNQMERPNGETENMDYSIEQIKAFAAGDTESFMRILTAFLNSTFQNLEDFKYHLQNKNKKRLVELAHKMLPMFRQLEAHIIVFPLEKIEQEDPLVWKNDEWPIICDFVYLKIEKLANQIQRDFQIGTGL